MDWILVFASLCLGPLSYGLFAIVNTYWGNNNLLQALSGLAAPIALAVLILLRTPGPIYAFLLSTLGGALTAALVGTLLLFLMNKFDMFEFVWGDEHGGDLFLLLVLIMIGLWGALSGAPGDFKKGLSVALASSLGLMLLSSLRSGSSPLKNKLSYLLFSVVVGAAAAIVGQLIKDKLSR